MYGIMVVFLDLDEDAPDLSSDPRDEAGYTRYRFELHGGMKTKELGRPVSHGDERPNPNINGFSAALGCYP